MNIEQRSRRGSAWLATCLAMLLTVTGWLGLPSTVQAAPQQTERQILKCYQEGRALFCEQRQLQRLINEAGSTPTRIEIGNDIETELTKTIVIPAGADIELVDTEVAPWGSNSKIIRDNGDFTGSLIRVEKGGKLTLSDGTGRGDGITIDSRAQWENAVRGETFAPTIAVNGELVMNAGSITGARKVSGNYEGGAITVRGEEAKFTLNGGQITDNARKMNAVGSTQYGSANVALTDGATMVMNGGEISDGAAQWSRDAYGEVGGIGVYQGARLEINGGTITKNSGWAGNINVMNWIWDCPKPGEDTSESRSTLVINDGEISSGWAKFGGGGVNVFGNAQVTMKGGSITGNAAPNGGGVNAMDLYAWGASGSWNEVPGDGMNCGFSPDEWSKVSPGGFTMNGGSITENKADRTGGGVNSVSNAVELNAGLIEGNVAYEQGGGVYVASDSFSARFKDTLITENSATFDSSLSYGGGIWLCPTGDLETHVTNGVAIFGNEAPAGSRSSHWGDDIAHDFYGNGFAARIQMDQRMLGGGEATFYRDGASVSPARFDADNPGKEQVFDGIERPSDDNHDYKTSLGNEGLKTVADQSAKKRAKSWAKLTIQKNHAPRGAGVGSNGTLVFGTPQKTEVKVTKAWKTADGKDLDAKSTVPVKVQLIGKVEIGKDKYEKFELGSPVKLNAKNAWTHTFKDLPTTKTVDGEQLEIEYSVEEQGVDSVTVEMSGSAKDGLTISAPAAVTPLKVQLMESTGAEKSPVGDPVELNAGNDWTHTFKDLPATKEVAGKQAEITYSTKGLGVSGFTFKITRDAADGFTITNTQTPPPVTEVSVTKVWKAADGSELDPSATVPVKVQLVKTVGDATSKVGDPVELNVGNGWRHTFKDLPQYKVIDGKRTKIAYSVEELPVEGFTSKVSGDAENGFTVTNTENPPVTTEVDVTKVWKAADGSDLDAESTMPVNVQLVKTVDGKSTPVGDPVELNAGNGWKHTFTGLPVTEKVDGKKVDVAYSVEERAVEGFTSRVSGDAEKGFTVTNTENPPVTTEVDVLKVWKDADGAELDAESTTPVKVQLVKTVGDATSKVGDPVELNAGNGWKHSFTQLPIAEEVDGQLVDVTYSVEELAVEGFTSKVTGNAQDGFTITNTQTPPPPTPTPEPSPTPEPTPTPGPTPGKPKPRPSMPRTGVDGGSAAVWAVAGLLGVGAAFLGRRRR